MTTRMFIDGAWVDAASGETIEATSPATGESLGRVAWGDREDARRAIAAAGAAFPAWEARTAFERAAMMHRAADVMERRKDELARMNTLDQGKPLVAEAAVEVEELVQFFRMAAEDAVRLEGSIPESQAPGPARAARSAARSGTLGLITPWNWPYTMPAEVLAPALACGNCVVWTPAPSTAVCSGLMAECIAEADLPPGVFNFVLGPGPEVGDELAVNPGTQAVGFTGSTSHRADRRAARGGQGAAAGDGRQRPARGPGRRRRRRRRRRGGRGVLPRRRAELLGGRAAARPPRRARRVRRAPAAR